MSRVLLVILALGVLSSCGEAAPDPQPAIEPEVAPPTAEEIAAEEARLAAEEAERLAAEETAAAEAEEAARLAAEEQAAREAAELAEAERLAFERLYPLHGVCYHYLAQVFSSAGRGRVIGYMRRGATFRAGPSQRGRDCEGGWHEVPGGGFVCSGAGFRIGEDPQRFEDSPVQPDLEAPMPYRYAFLTRDNLPQFWRVPSAEERTTAMEAIERLVALETPPEEEVPEAEETEAPVDDEPAESPAPESDTPGATEDVVEEEAEPETAEPSLDAVSESAASEEGDTESVVEQEAIEAPAPPGQEAEPMEESVEPAEAAEVASEESAEEEPALPSYVRMRMREGFFVSLDDPSRSASEAYARTVRGGYVASSSLQETTGSEGRGVVLGSEWRLPIGFVYRAGTRSLRREEEDGPLSLAGDLVPHAAFVIHDTFIRRERRYAVNPDGLIVRERSLRVASHIERPPDVGEEDQWVHVDLAQQVLVAYEGDRPVFTTMVASGQEGHETPTGLFAVQSKHITTTMDNLEDPSGAYSIEDVPWTMYFDGNFALHAAFWHDRFGRVRSHGCVNLTPTDARWLFQWSQPIMPQGWHGLFVRRDHQRAWVYITD